MLEQELKFTVADAAVLDDVLQSDLVRSLVEGDADPPAERYHAVYYDTPDNRLEEIRCSLRARREGMRFRAALKLPGTLVDGLSQREEYEADIDRWPGAVADLPGDEFRKRVEELVPADSPLVARIEVDMLRRVVHLSAGSSQVELVLDEGEIRAGGRQAALCEIELELMRGDVADVLELGAELERTFPLKRSLLSKHAIGISLLGEKSAHVGDGSIPGVAQVPSPNCDERPEGTLVDTLVIHAISLPPDEFGGGHVQELFCNTLDPAAHPYFAEISHLRVSSHFLVGRDGAVTQFVPLDRRAWHAGESRFRGREKVNDFSVGVEMEGCDSEPFTDAQYTALVDLTRRIRQACPAITTDRITGHCDISPGRKTDPGPCFDWRRYLVTLEAE